MISSTAKLFLSFSITCWVFSLFSSSLFFALCVRSLLLFMLVMPWHCNTRSELDSFNLAGWVCVFVCIHATTLFYEIIKVHIQQKNINDKTECNSRANSQNKNKINTNWRAFEIAGEREKESAKATLQAERHTTFETKQNREKKKIIIQFRNGFRMNMLRTQSVSVYVCLREYKRSSVSPYKCRYAWKNKSVWLTTNAYT